MIVPFVTYRTSTGDITGTGICPVEVVNSQVQNSDESVYIGDADPSTQKIDTETGLPIDKTETEKLEWSYTQIQHLSPSLSDINAINDTELNARIEEFYLGLVSATSWRLEHWEELRVAAYSKLSDRADADVKIKIGTKTGNADLIAEGEAQMDTLDDHDWAVKQRFPKEEA